MKTLPQIDFEVTVSNYAADIRKLYSLFRPNVQPESVQCEEFEVGVINRMVKMDDPVSRDPIVIRIFRMKIIETLSVEKQEKERANAALANRELEVAAVRQASALGITVKLCATFRNGFIYRFVDGEMLTFERYDFELAKKVATKIAQIHHRMDLGALASPAPVVSWMLGKADDPQKMQEEREFIDRKMKESPFEEHRSQLPGFIELVEEMERIYETLSQKNALGPVCFSHNDLNFTNVLVDRNAEPVLLDFEWADTNHQMFDLSVHLVSCGNRFGHYQKAGVPSEPFVRQWLRFYYEAANEMNKNSKMTETKFERFIDNELKKVLANMLFIQLMVTKLSIESTYKYPGQIPDKQNVQYAVEVYEDFLTKRDQHLSLLDSLEEF